MLLTEDHQALHDVATRFARERLRPGYQQREHEDGIDRALCREMGDLGLIGVDLPEALGGMGQGGVAAGLIIEAVAYGDFNVAYVQADADARSRLPSGTGPRTSRCRSSGGCAPRCPRPPPGCPAAPPGAGPPCRA